jgi:hypothetical protein
MNLMRTKAVLILLAGAVLFAMPGPSVYASCATGGPLVHNLTGTTYFNNCGPAPIAFAWGHKTAVQRIIAANNTNSGTVAGMDSGNRQTFDEAMFLMTVDTGGTPIPGAYQGQTDFGNPNWDGCGQVAAEGGVNSPCTGFPDWGPLNYALAGVDPATPNIAKVALLSVDWNEFFGAWVLDNAGAPAGDGDPCVGDAFQFNPAPVDCQPIPIPAITGTGACSAAGCNISIGSPDIGSAIASSVLDDCAVAETDALNCPRNLYQGRILVFKKGACTPSTAAGNRRTWVYPAAPATGSLTVAPDFTIFSLEDTNLNGVLDANENDGAATPPNDNANGRLDPFIIPGTAAANTSIFVPAVPGATDCIFLGMGYQFDQGGGCVNPPTCTIFGESVVSPMVSVNTIPIRSGSGTPVTDVVTTIRASKSQGKGTVSWETGIESATSGFNVIGTKKGGGETKLNGSLIAATEGTTGKGASYTVTFDGGQLKGSTSVYVEIVKTDGSKERFGPASF